MTKHFAIPFEYVDYDMLDGVAGIQYQAIKFVGDFGCFKAGEEFQVLDLEDEECILRAYIDGECIKEQKFKLEPVDA